MLTRLALREILNNRKFSILFILNIALGISGFIFLDAFKQTLQEKLSEGSKNILTADISIEAKNRFITQPELKTIEKILAKHEEASASQLSAFSMIAHGTKSKLVYLIGITDNHPLYGSLKLKKSGSILGTSEKAIFSTQSAWINQEIAVQLEVGIGDQIKIGESTFTVDDIITDDSSNTASAFAFAPRIYINQAHIKQTNLLQPGSRFNDIRLYKVPPSVSIETLESELNSNLPDTTLRIITHKKASQNLNRSLTYLNDYLGLIALIALFLSAVGSTYLFRSYLASKIHEIATLLSLGVQPTQVLYLYLLQLFFLGSTASIVSLMISYVFFPLVPYISSDLLPITVQPTLSGSIFVVALGIGSLTSILVCLPEAIKITNLKPAVLFQEQSLKTHKPVKQFLLYLPLVALLFLLAIYESQSIQIGSLFSVIFILATVVLTLVSWVIFKALGSYTPYIKSLQLKLAIRQLARNKLSTATGFLAVSLGSLMVCLVPQLYSTIISEVTTPKGTSIPSLFLVDIQDDQLSDLKESVKAAGTELEYISPLIRARLTQINNERLVKESNDTTPITREDQRRKWVRTRPQNITSRLDLRSSETLLSGRPFTSSYDWNTPDKLPEISLEMRFAHRLGVKVGDTIGFDVQGVEITGEVVNIRQVRWTTFQPNFFILFQPGVLDDAPKTYLASIPDLDTETQLNLQRQLVENFSNISIVDIKQTVKQILIILDKMSWIIAIMAIFALLVGLLVLYSIAYHQIQERRWDISLLKILGGSFTDIRRTIILEFLTLSLLAAISGATLSYVASYGFATFVFRTPWEFIVVEPLVVVVGVVSLSVMIAALISQKTLNTATRAILSQD